MKKSDRLQMALLVLVCIALYGQTIGFAYVWDDAIIFLNKNSLVVEPLSWRLLTEPILEGTSYMRPLVLLSWWVEFHLFGQIPSLSHGVNVAILILNVLLLRSIARCVLDGQGEALPAFWATMAALCYAVHPALIESSAWVSGRFDLLATAGILGSTRAFLAYRRPTAVRVAGVLLGTLTALASKELGVVTPAILLCLWMATQADVQTTLGQNLRRAFHTQAPVWLASALLLLGYFVVRRLSMGQVYHGIWGPDYLMALLRSQLPLEALKFYTSMVIWPFGRVGIFHPFSTLKLDAFAVLGNLATLALTVAVLWQAFRRQKPWAWLLMAAYVGIALVLHLIPLSVSDNVAQERFMAMPLAFVAMAFVCFPWRAAVDSRLHLRPRARRTAAVLSLGGWLMFATFVTASLIPLWARPELLWRWAHFQNPEVLNVRFNYMEAALSSGRSEWVQAEIDRLIKKNGGLEVGEQAIYASLLMRQGNAESLKYFEGVLHALPKFHAMPDGERALAFFPVPRSVVGAVYTNYALSLLLFEGNTAGALENNRISRWYMKNVSSGHLNYSDAAIYYALGDLERADRIVEENKDVYFDDKDKLIRQMYSIVKAFCESWQDKDASSQRACASLRQRKLLENHP
ncbi:hypothetical protein [Mitsuaria sp. WAJ17]|uniref:hypothetical protein n=1 Tax=Mitsuaria sp. WAJ17 TaxID=2761452 RepID=UPI0016025C6A|nr:hypothetical protein [Mitsuaria sp. WAJ17]